MTRIIRLWPRFEFASSTITDSGGWFIRPETSNWQSRTESRDPGTRLDELTVFRFEREINGRDLGFLDKSIRRSPIPKTRAN